MSHLKKFTRLIFEWVGLVGGGAGWMDGSLSTKVPDKMPNKCNVLENTVQKV